MSAFRRKYTVKGKPRRAKRWSVSFLHDGTLYRQGKFESRDQAEFWEAQKKLSLGRGEIGMPDRAQKNQKLTKIIDEFIADLTANKRDNMYVYTFEHRLKRVADEAGWLQLKDVNLEDFKRWRSNPPTDRKRKRIKSAKTFNQYLEHWQQFSKWCARYKGTRDPFQYADPMTVIEGTPYRRAATPDEFRKMLAKVDSERRLFYLFVLYTPLRRKTLSRIQWGDLHLDESPAWARLRGETNKSHVIEKSAIQSDLVPELLKRRGKPDEKVFKSIPSVQDIRDDWEAAGITFSDKIGRSRLDLHAFRKTAIKWLKAAGVTIEQAAQVLHHKDIRTTQRHYDEDTIAPPLAIAIDRMEKIT